MSNCNICDGRLQKAWEPLKFSGHLKVWSCAECFEILKDVPPKENDAQAQD